MTYTLFCFLMALVGCGVDYLVLQGELRDAEFILKEVEDTVDDVIEYDEEPYMPDVHKN